MERYSLLVMMSVHCSKGSVYYSLAPLLGLFFSHPATELVKGLETVMTMLGFGFFANSIERPSPAQLTF